MKLKLAALAIAFCFFNCKQEATTKTIDFDYKYPSVQKMLDCENLDTALFQEALQSFESDIVNFYTPDNPVYSRAYSVFVAQGCSDKANYQKLVSDHSKKVFEALQQVDNLWIDNPNGRKLNYQHPIFQCIGAKMKKDPIRKTYNALIETNSMTVRMFEGQLRRNTFDMKDDKYLATFVALELFYGKLTDVDFNAAVEDNSNAPNTTESHDSHDGHDH